MSSCAEWGENVLKEIADDPSIDAVLFANFTQQYATPVDRSLGRSVTESDFSETWSRVQQMGKKVIVVRDLPNAGATNVPVCVAQHLSDYDPCPTPRADALPGSDPQWSAANLIPAIGKIDMTNYLCGPEVCHSVVGGLIVYFDAHHLTATYARTMSPFLGSAIATQLPASSMSFGLAPSPADHRRWRESGDHTTAARLAPSVGRAGSVD